MKKSSLPQYTLPYAEEIVFRNIPKDSKKILDFGCGDGHFLNYLLKLKKELYGCDTDKDVILKNKKSSKKINFSVIKPSEKTHFRDNYFDCITLMGVLEHVADEKQTLKEIYRILKPGGSLFIYVHNKGLFRFLDGANLKHAFPSIHKIIWIMLHGKESYNKEFVLKKDYGMVGDTTVGKKWHTHYSASDLQKFIEKNFLLDRIWYYSLIIPIFLVLEFLYIVTIKKRSKIISSLIQLDSKIDVGRFSYNIVIKCIKKS